MQSYKNDTIMTGENVCCHSFNIAFQSMMRKMVWLA